MPPSAARIGSLDLGSISLSLGGIIPLSVASAAACEPSAKGSSSNSELCCAHVRARGQCATRVDAPEAGHCRVSQLLYPQTTISSPQSCVMGDEIDWRMQMTTHRAFYIALAT
jgi:hypothetical protein